jgi:hypothetical protein
MRFPGFIKHGIALDDSYSSGAGSHWEAYEIEQTHGSSVWLVAATADGTIQRIEVAVE